MAMASRRNNKARQTIKKNTKNWEEKMMIKTVGKRAGERGSAFMEANQKNKPYPIYKMFTYNFCRAVILL